VNFSKSFVGCRPTPNAFGASAPASQVSGKSASLGRDLQNQTSNVEHASHLIRHPTQRRAALLVISSEVEKSLNVPLRAVANIQHSTFEMLRILSGI
jgi:hypothetical protein